MKQNWTRMDTDRYKSMAIAKFPFLDYSETIFIDSLTKVNFKCPHHGIVSQDPYTHLRSENGCPLCGKEVRAKNRINNRAKKLEQEFVKKHGHRYTYKWDTYKGMGQYMIITCPEHGDFEQFPSSHLIGRGCPKCASTERGMLRRLGKEKILARFYTIYGDKYDYSLIPENVLSDEHVTVICPKHGKFDVTVTNHMRQSGCPGCAESHGERAVRNVLNKRNVPFSFQHRFDECKHILKLPFDFYLPTKNTVIEYHGQQHFRSVDVFGGEKAYASQQKRDEIKAEFCHKNGIKLEIIRYDESVKTRMNEILAG